MPPRRVVNRLQLGPIVGHTDENSSRVWIQVFDPEKYELRVQGAGLFPFRSTETTLGLPLEFRTALADVQGLRSDWRYHYNILRKGRSIPGSNGTFRTMPINGSMANILFCAISCSKVESEGAWDALDKFVEKAKPHFIVMMGDQIYVDEDNQNIFLAFRRSSSSVRRKALAEKYRESWSRKSVKQVMANVPIYMMWDDHDLRDGWGSMASDSETLVQKYPRGKEIFQECMKFFEDARDIYWHFQACHNPPDPELPPPHGQRRAMPYAFRCGRLVVLMLDSRGERDVFRKDLPILGSRQWKFIDDLIKGLSEDVDALAVMTPTPIASLDPEGQVQKIMGERTDDVESFKKGDFDRLFDPVTNDSKLGVLLTHELSRIPPYNLTIPKNFFPYKAYNIDEGRDQWSHKFSRPEQIALIRAAGNARLTNRNSGSPRGLIFLSGDIHNGCIFDITVSEPSYKAVSLTSSGISTVFKSTPIVGVSVDEDFDVAPGIRSTLRDIVMDYNFGVVQVVPTGSGAEIVPSLAHEGNSFTVGLDIADLL